MKQRVERAERVECAERVEGAERAGGVERVPRVECVGRVEREPRVERVPRADRVGRTDRMASTEGQVVPLRRLDERLTGLAELSDEALLAACGVGDAAALGALFDRYHEAVFRLVSRLVRSEASEVDDIVQTTFLEAWRSAKRYGARGSVKSFLFGIAANTVRHHVRSAKRRREAYAGIEEAARAPTTPHDVAQRAQEMQRLARALAELPHDLRAAYVVFDLEEMSGAEAAQILGVREGTFWRRLHDARRALRDALGGTR